VGSWDRQQAFGQPEIDEHRTTFTIAAQVAGADVAVDEATAVQVGQGISHVLGRSGQATEAIFATGGGQMCRQIGSCQVVGHQKESASQRPCGNASRVSNSDDPAMAEVAQAGKLIEQACDSRWLQPSGKQLHSTG
jgi:hypothetical protein